MIPTIENKNKIKFDTTAYERLSQIFPNESDEMWESIKEKIPNDNDLDFELIYALFWTSISKFQELALHFNFNLVNNEQEPNNYWLYRFSQLSMKNSSVSGTLNEVAERLHWHPREFLLSDANLSNQKKLNKTEKIDWILRYFTWSLKATSTEEKKRRVASILEHKIFEIDRKEDSTDPFCPFDIKNSTLQNNEIPKRMKECSSSLIEFLSEIIQNTYPLKGGEERRNWFKEIPTEIWSWMFSLREDIGDFLLNTKNLPLAKEWIFLFKTNLLSANRIKQLCDLEKGKANPNLELLIRQIFHLFTNDPQSNGLFIEVVFQQMVKENPEISCAVLAETFQENPRLEVWIPIIISCLEQGFDLVTNVYQLGWWNLVSVLFTKSNHKPSKELIVIVIRMLIRSYNQYSFAYPPPDSIWKWIITNSEEWVLILLKNQFYELLICCLNISTPYQEKTLSDMVLMGVWQEKIDVNITLSLTEHLLRFSSENRPVNNILGKYFFLLDEYRRRFTDDFGGLLSLKIVFLCLEEIKIKQQDLILLQMSPLLKNFHDSHQLKNAFSSLKETKKKNKLKELIPAIAKLFAGNPDYSISEIVDTIHPWIILYKNYYKTIPAEIYRTIYPENISIKDKIAWIVPWLRKLITSHVQGELQFSMKNFLEGLEKNHIAHAVRYFITQIHEQWDDYNQAPLQKDQEMWLRETTKLHPKISESVVFEVYNSPIKTSRIQL